MRTLAAALAALAAFTGRALAAPPPSPARPAAEPPVEARRRVVAERVIALGAALRREIERGDVAALAARVPSDGLRCAGLVVPRARVVRDLRTPGSWLHATIFGGPGAPPPPEGAAASLRDFFGRAGPVEIAVGFVPDPRAAPVGRPCLWYRAKALAPPPLTLCFEARGRSWVFEESLYPCG